MRYYNLECTILSDTNITSYDYTLINNSCLDHFWTNVDCNIDTGITTEQPSNMPSNQPTTQPVDSITTQPTYVSSIDILSSFTSSDSIDVTTEEPEQPDSTKANCSFQIMISLIGVITALFCV